MIGITGALAAPVNQLAEPTADGQPDENARDNCAAACLSWACRQLCGVSVDGDTLKDAAYGQGYIGLTAIDNYIAAAAPYGLHIVDRPVGLDSVKAALGNGHPAIVAIPSDWGDEPPSSPYLHFVCIVQGTGGQLTAMNPWGGFWQTQPEAWWSERFRLTSVWELERTQEAPAVWTIERNDQGTVTGAHDAHGAHVGTGFAWELTQHPAWLASDAVLGESYYSGNKCVCVLDNGAWMDWQGDTNALTAHSDGGAVVAELYQLTVAAAAKIGAVNGQLAEANAQIKQLDAELSGAGLTPAQQADVAAVEAIRAALGLPAQTPAPAPAA